MSWHRRNMYYTLNGEPHNWQDWPQDMVSTGGPPNSPPDLVDQLGSDDNSSLSPRSSGSKKLDGKKCGVCGDRALGYNFNAITCESCKAFFRRNALKNKEFRCPFSGNCEVTAITRRFCQRCRLRKCFDVGMKKEWIMTDDEKKKKKKKIEENRQKKTEGGNEEESEDSCYSSHTRHRKKYDETLEEEDQDNNSSSQKKFIEMMNDEDLSGDSLSPQQPPMQTLKPPKPQAVVVGRVRTQEPSPKKFKKNSENEDGASKSLDPLHFLDSSYIECLSEDSVVADLLRNRTAENQEDEEEEGQGKSSHQEEQQQCSSGVIVKMELSTGTGTVTYKSDSTEESKESGPCSPSICKQSSAESSKGFEFSSIQETLKIINPSCKKEELSSSTSTNNVMESILESAIHAEYSGITLWRNPGEDSLQLNQAERVKIGELLEASNCLTVPLCEDSNFNKFYMQDFPDPSLINVINLTDLAIRRLIKMAKRISAFKNFCQEDQIALLKTGCTEMMILRSVSAFDPDKEVWKIPQDHQSFQSIHVKVLQNASKKIYEEHKRFMLSFEPEWRQDAQIMAILSAISLFSPQRQNVVHFQAIEHEQKSYFFLLKRYLESQYGACIGKTNYYRLLKIIGDLHILNMDHVRVFLEANPKEVEPLLIEIFDLKNTNS